MSELIEEIKFSQLCKFQPKQLEATRQADLHQYFLYGGSRGPGKSYWLRWYLLRELLKLAKMGIQTVVGLFCEDYPALTDRQTSKISKEFPAWLGEIKDSKTFGFGFYLRPEYGSGVLALRNLDDVSKYQSAEFAAIGVDELTKNEENVFDILRGSLRWAGVDRPRFVAATNPGGLGHVWVRKFWIDKNLPERLSKVASEFYFVPALPTDNTYLSESYWQMLETLPDRLKKAWRFGDWDAFEGQFFTLNEATQVIDPFEIPDGWRIIAGLDPGYSSPCCFSISAMDFDESMYMIATYYEQNRSPIENAVAINEFIKNLKYTRGQKPELIVADPAAWQKRDRYATISTDKTFADVFADNGLYLQRGVNDRIQGWWAMKDIMGRKAKQDVNGQIVEVPKYYVFKGLNQPFLDEINSAIGDEHNPEDIQGRGNNPAVSDHALDPERYKIMAIYKPLKKPVDTRKAWQIRLAEKKKQKMESGKNKFMRA